MLDKTGDLIPVRYEAVNIPWTKRKSQVLNFIHRGTVRFETQVYDTNVGDISPLSSYFNPQRWTVRDLNEKFGIQTQTPELSVGVDAASPVPEGDEDISEADIDLIAKEESLIDDKTGLPIRCLLPRLLIYPEKEPHRVAKIMVSCPSIASTGSSRTPSPPTVVQAFHHDSNSGSCMSSIGTDSNSATMSLIPRVFNASPREESTDSYDSLGAPRRLSPTNADYAVHSLQLDDASRVARCHSTKLIGALIDETTNDAFNLNHRRRPPPPLPTTKTRTGSTPRKSVVNNSAISGAALPPTKSNKLLRLTPNSALMTRRRKMTADDALFNNDSIAGGHLGSHFQPKRQKGAETLGRARFNSLSSAIMDIAKIESIGNTSAVRSPGSVEHLRPVKNTLCFGGRLSAPPEEHTQVGHTIVRRDAVEFLLSSARKHTAAHADGDTSICSWLSTSDQGNQQRTHFNETLV